MTASSPSTSLPLRTRLLYGLADWGPTTTGTAIMFFFAFFLTDVVLLPPGFVAPVLLIGGIWDAINDPFIGSLADRVRTRWGRRRPFFLFASVPFGLAFILLWYKPPFESYPALAVYYTIAYILYDTFSTLLSVPYTSITPELTDDYDERTRLTAYRMVVSMAGGIITSVAIPIVTDLFPEKRTGYLLIASIIGLTGMIPFLMLFFGLRERFSNVPLPSLGVYKGFLYAIKNTAFRYTAGIFTFAWATVNLVASLIPYYLTYWMHQEGKLEIVLGLIQVMALICIPAVVWIAGKIGKPGVYMAGASWWVIAMLLISLIPFKGNMIYVYLLVASVGFGVAAAHIVPWALIPDVIETDELQTGMRREGVFYGFMVFIQKSGTAFVLAFMQWILHLTGYVANGTQTPQALNAIRFLIGPVPAILLTVSILLAWKFPITRQLHQQNVAQAAARRSTIGPD